MKKLLLTGILLLFISVTSYGQWSKSGNFVYPTDLNDVVGIGTSTPAYLMHAAKFATEPHITIQNLGSNGGATFRMIDNLSGADFKFKSTFFGDFKIRDESNALDVFYIRGDGSGKTGIGTGAPQAKLHVAGSDSISGLFVNNGFVIGNHALQAVGINGPTKGYMAVQGGTNFDGNPELDISGMEIGMIGLSTGASTTDNVGVLGHSNGWAGRFQNSISTNQVLAGGAGTTMELSSPSTSGTWLSLGNLDAGGAWYQMISTGSANGGGGAGRLEIWGGTGGGTVTQKMISMSRDSGYINMHQNVGIGYQGAGDDLVLAGTDSATQAVIRIGHTGAFNEPYSGAIIFDEDVKFSDGSANYCGIKMAYNGATNLMGYYGTCNLVAAQDTILLMSRSGGVGIGTAPTAGHSLSVCGSIRAEEVVVETGWCDYVFEKSYILRPLEEVEEFINANKHLPEIPSASEVEGEGLKLAEMSSKFMLKIEELTLYLIEQNKQIKAQQLTIDELRSQMNSLK